MAILTPGLDRLAAMQRQPFTPFSAMRRSSPVATQYKRQSEMYGQALRTLSRAARRGDAEAAIDAIGLRDTANADGYTPGGIQTFDENQGNIAGREQKYQTGAQDLERKATLDRRSGGIRMSPENRGMPVAAPTPSGVIPSRGQLMTQQPKPIAPEPAVGSLGSSLAAGRGRVEALKAKWAQDDPTQRQTDYEMKNGTPAEQAMKLRRDRR